MARGGDLVDDPLAAAGLDEVAGLGDGVCGGDLAHADLSGRRGLVELKVSDLTTY